MIINNEAKANEILSDIGYYRLGFYQFPFECQYPNKNHRNHAFKANTTFEDAVRLYYFDNDLRKILIPFLHRVEINFRTRVIYTASNEYKNFPTWFANNKFVSNRFINDLRNKFYSDIKKNEAIKRHHRKYSNDVYAPAWKTLEYMTFGNMLYLFENLKSQELQINISRQYGIENLEVFISVMKTIRDMRNVCAHGHNMFDINFRKSIKPGNIKGMTNTQRHNISGGLIVLHNILSSISASRAEDLKNAIVELTSSGDVQCIKPIIEHVNFNLRPKPQNGK